MRVFVLLFVWVCITERIGNKPAACMRRGQQGMQGRWQQSRSLTLLHQGARWGGVSYFPLLQQVQIAAVMLGLNQESWWEACDTSVSMHWVPAPWASGELALWQRIWDFPVAVTGPYAHSSGHVQTHSCTPVRRRRLLMVPTLSWRVPTCGTRGWVRRGCEARGL